MASIEYTIEYILKSSTRVLFNRLSTASGLTEWFADNVTVDGSIYTFTWDGADQAAELVFKKDQKSVKFKWLDEEDTFFQFEIVTEELTGDVALLITDYAEEDEMEDAKNLWDSQISQLKHLLGS